MQIRNFKRPEYIVPAIYLLLVLIGLYFAVPMTTENSDWFFRLMFLTLPWSFLTFFMIMGAIHNSSSDQATISLVVVTSFLNAFLFYFFARKVRIRKKKPYDKKLGVPVAEGDKDNSLG